MASGVIKNVKKKSFTKALKTISTSRRRRESFDIDNIVIPYSIAAATRVEKLNYKEIIIPSWRETCDKGVVITNSNEGGDNSDYEDLNDDVYVVRHDRALSDEHSRYMGMGAMQTRRRTIDSDPSSPFQGEDSLHSPLNINTTDSKTTLDSNKGGKPHQEHKPSRITRGMIHRSSTDSVRSGRSNSGSSSVGTESVNKRLRSTSGGDVVTIAMSSSGGKGKGEPIQEDQQEIIKCPSYPLRSFPLTDDEIEQLAKEKPTTPATVSQTQTAPKSTPPVESATVEISDDSELEDPNDPEWSIDQTEEEKE